MESEKKQFDQLLTGFLHQSLTADELALFWELLRLTENQERLSAALDNDLHHPHLESLSNPEQLAKAQKALTEKLYENKPRWMAAASIALLLGFAASLLFILPGRNKRRPPLTPGIVQDVAAPDATHAVLTLASGQRILLDSAESGVLARQGQTSIIKQQAGGIVYKGISQEARTTGVDLQYNILTVPKGSKIAQLSLEDGTLIWVNAGSSLKYPANFGEKERSVEITGEAYFEVSKNSNKPFKVHINPSSPEGGSTIQVLGTHFNVNAYKDEERVKVTLLEGAVRVNNQMTTSLLQPGEQAQVSERIKVVNNVDLEEAVAWKNGQFSYSNAGLEEIMKQMSRWYGVDVVYEEKILDKYTINVPKSIPVSQLLKFIEFSGGVHFVLEGKKVIVKK